MAGEHTGQTKVGVVGAGMVGTSFAYALMQRGIASDLVLIDAQHEKAEGEVMDLTHGLPFVRPMRISAGDYADLTGAAVTVVTAGQAQGGKDESRLDLLERNAEVMRQVIPAIVKHNPDGVIVIASNPVDLLTHLAVKISGVPPTQVFGSGTILDTARFRALLSAHYTVDPRSVHAYIIGEHGDSEVPLWSLANIQLCRATLYRTFKQHGMVEVAVEPVAVPMLDLGTCSYLLKLDDLQERALRAGAVTQGEVARFQASLERATRMDAFFSSFNFVTVVGRKP